MRFNLDQIFKRAQATYPELRDRTMAEFRYACHTQTIPLLAGGINTAAVQDFPAEAILFCVIPGVSLDGQPGTTAHRSELSCISVGVSYSDGQQIIVKNPGRAIA